MAADYLVIKKIVGCPIWFRRIVRLWNPQLYFLNCARSSDNCSIMILPLNKLLESK